MNWQANIALCILILPYLLGWTIAIMGERDVRKWMEETGLDPKRSGKP